MTSIRKEEDPVDMIPLFVSALNGAIIVPSYMAVTGDMPVNIRLSMLLFVLAMLGAAVSSFLTSGLRGRQWRRCILDGLLAGSWFFFGGIIPLITSAIIPDKLERMQMLVGATSSMVVVIMCLYCMLRIDKKIKLLGDNQGRRKVKVTWLVVSMSLIAPIVMVLFAGNINNLRSKILRETYSRKQ